MRQSFKSAFVASAALAGALVLLSGCASSGRNDDGRHSAIQGDLSPELDTLHQRPIDIDDAMYYTFDTNGRMFWADLYRALHLDRPSRLQRVTVPY